MNTQGNEYALLSLSATAKLMQISPSTLAKLINEGKIGVLCMGKREKIPMSEIRRYVDDNMVRGVRSNFNFNKMNPHDILSRPQKMEGTMNGDQILKNLLAQER